MLEKKLSFEEWRNHLFEIMKEYQVGPILKVDLSKINNNDVPNFLREYRAFVRRSRKAKIMVCGNYQKQYVA